MLWFCINYFKSETVQVRMMPFYKHFMSLLTDVGIQFLCNLLVILLLQMNSNYWLHMNQVIDTID